MTGRQPRLVTATVKYGVEQIPVTIDFGRRKHMYITVNPDRTVLVKAPQRASLDTVLAFAQERAPWIYEHIRYFELHQPLPLARPYVRGETFLYLGDHYRLEVVCDAAEDVRIAGGHLVVRTTDSLFTDVIGKLVERWYVQQARAVFADRLAICFKAAAQLDVDCPTLRIRRKAGSWGTCSAEGWIDLNSELVKTPIECIDYVITHELCHLRHLDHSKAFYHVLSHCLPDWRERKECLDRYVL